MSVPEVKTVLWGLVLKGNKNCVRSLNLTLETRQLANSKNPYRLL